MHGCPTLRQYIYMLTNMLTKARDYPVLNLILHMQCPASTVFLLLVIATLAAYRSSWPLLGARTSATCCRRTRRLTSRDASVSAKCACLCAKKSTLRPECLVSIQHLRTTLAGYQFAAKLRVIDFCLHVLTEFQAFSAPRPRSPICRNQLVRSSFSDSENIQCCS
ncbi:hypothetical protein BKA62DRAFT_215198 [Auriculariales sp. MPI-PUGE-AT-0066]|nr:hypothetical protein BKA62DRAFT_215198 [Auriculariales sp. MPI-PUGE-AT-0066]